MKRWTMHVAAIATIAMLAAGPVTAQQPQPQASPKSGDCAKAAPARVEGQVVSVDASAGRVMLRAQDGAMHEFQASKETLQTLKPGDRLEAKLREARKC